MTAPAIEQAGQVSGVVLRCASRRNGGFGPETGMWLQQFDAGSLGGGGWVRWTGNIADAHRFADAAAAHHAELTVPMLGWFRVEIVPAS